MKLSMFGKDFGSIIDFSEKAINKIFYDDDYFKSTKTTTKKYEPENIKSLTNKTSLPIHADLNNDISVIYKQLKGIYYSNNVEKFQKQATFIKYLEDNYQNEYIDESKFNSEICYSDFSFSNFRKYISWRTKLRNNENVKFHFNFISLYFKELVLDIHDMTNDEILLEMINLVNKFQNNKTFLFDSIAIYIKDFVILNEVSFTYDEIQAKLGSEHILFSQNFIDIDRNRYDKNLYALELQSSYSFLKSKLLSSKYGYLFGGCIDYTFKQMEEYFNQYNIDLFDALFKYSIKTGKIEWHPYNHSKFFNFTEEQIFDITLPNGERYIKDNPYKAIFHYGVQKKNILREGIGFAIKLIESRLRENLGFKTSIKANPQKVTIESPTLSYEELKRFRSIAPLFVTTEIQNLIINSVDSFYTLSKLPKGVASKTCEKQQKKVESNEINNTQLNIEIDNSKFNNIRQDSDYLRQVLVVEEENFDEQHSENEITKNDNIMEENKIENEISQNNFDDADEYHQLIYSLNLAELECLKIICNKQDILNKLNLLGNKHNLTAQTIMDSINEKALEIIGDNLIDSAEQPYIYEDYLTEIEKIIMEG